MSNDYILAIDNGTQSVRALIFDLHGHLVDKAQVEIDSYQAPQPGCFPRQDRVALPAVVWGGPSVGVEQLGDL